MPGSSASVRTSAPWEEEEREEEEEEGWEGRGGEMKNPAVLKTCNQHPLVSLRGNSGHRGAVVLCGIGRSVPARLSQLSNFQRLA